MPGLALISEPRRQQILRLVWHRELAAGEIADALPVTFGAVSQHLAKLTDAGFLVRRKEGRTVFYRTDRAALGPLAAALEEMWFGKLAALKFLAEAEEESNPRAKKGRRRPARGRKAKPGARKPRKRQPRHRSNGRTTE